MWYDLLWWWSSDQSSQVPQPTCYWKWVGFTIPLKQDNFTLRASRAFNMARTLEQANLLESSVYGEHFFSWQNIHTCIGCGATAAWRAPPVCPLSTSSLSVQITVGSQVDFSQTRHSIFLSWVFLHFYWPNCTVSVWNSKNSLVLDLFLLCDGNINSGKPNCSVLPNSEAPPITEFVPRSPASSLWRAWLGTSLERRTRLSYCSTLPSLLRRASWSVPTLRSSSTGESRYIKAYKPHQCILLHFLSKTSPTRLTARPTTLSGSQPCREQGGRLYWVHTESFGSITRSFPASSENSRFPLQHSEGFMLQFVGLQVDILTIALDVKEEGHLMCAFPTGYGKSMPMLLLGLLMPTG